VHQSNGDADIVIIQCAL